jgi:APA family basic amino acid/polyamine antiporter
MFVAFTGYGRIATLGEEIESPRNSIPLAIVVTLLISAALYLFVAVVAIASVGAVDFATAGEKHAAPLEIVARQFSLPGVRLVVAVGAMTAMLGVLLNLILGLSRVVLAMGRRHDIPKLFAKLNRDETTPYAAVIFVGIAIAALSLLGDVKTTWSFSAFTVLVYYALTNLSALRMKRDEQLYPPPVAWLGLVSCLFHAFWVERTIWLVGLALVALGIGWWTTARWIARRET